MVKPDWSAYDKEVELAAEDDVRVMPFVWGSPEWVASEPSELPVKTSLAALGVAEVPPRSGPLRYGPEGEFWEDHTKLDYLPITHWEIWNEENIVSQAAEPPTRPNTRS